MSELNLKFISMFFGVFNFKKKKNSAVFDFGILKLLINENFDISNCSRAFLWTCGDFKSVIFFFFFKNVDSKWKLYFIKMFFRNKENKCKVAKLNEIAFKRITFFCIT